MRGMQMMTDDFLDQPPSGPSLTAYDKAHLKLYVRLLDADAARADWQEVAQVLFGLDARAEPQRASSVYATHLARAKWMTENGFSQLLGRLNH